MAKLFAFGGLVVAIILVTNSPPQFEKMNAEKVPALESAMVQESEAIQSTMAPKLTSITANNIPMISLVGMAKPQEDSAYAKFIAVDFKKFSARKIEVLRQVC